MSERVSDERLARLPGLLEAAERRVNVHVFGGPGDSALATIPANPERDVDLLLMEAAKVCRDLAAVRADLAEALGLLRESRSEGWHADDAGWERVDALLRKVGM